MGVCHHPCSANSSNKQERCAQIVESQLQSPMRDLSVVGEGPHPGQDWVPAGPFVERNASVPIALTVVPDALLLVSRRRRCTRASTHPPRRTAALRPRRIPGAEEDVPVGQPRRSMYQSATQVVAVREQPERQCGIGDSPAICWGPPTADSEPAPSNRRLPIHTFAGYDRSSHGALPPSIEVHSGDEEEWHKVERINVGRGRRSGGHRRPTDEMEHRLVEHLGPLQWCEVADAG
jgi:hypothetical protein